MSRFTLKDLESLTGINSDTIRIWERRYNILNPKLTVTGRKWYEDDDLKKLINISILNNKRIKISRIAKMSNKEIADYSTSLSELSKNSGNMISSLVIAMNSLDENSVNELIMKSVISRGFEGTFTKVLFPFLRKVGVMWYTGAINPATEHFVTGVFRQRISAAIDSLPPVNDINAKRILMFLPEGEFHELTLLFFSYVLKKKGHRILYLGQSTPFDSIIQAVALWKPEVVITGIHTELNLPDPGEYLRKLSENLKKQKIYAGGGLADYADKLKFRNVKALRSENDPEFLSL